MSQRSFSDIEYSGKRKQTRRDRFRGGRHHALGGAGGGDRAALPEGEARPPADELWSSLVYEQLLVQAALRSVMEDASSLVGSVCSTPSMNVTPRSSLSSHS